MDRCVFHLTVRGKLPLKRTSKLFGFQMIR